MKDGNARERSLFNPTYSKNVKTNVGKVFLQLLKKHFPASHILNKIFNKNTVKISYSCTKNINSVISSHNKNILNPRTASFGCNCRKKESCPLSGECLTSQLVYRATVTNTAYEDINKYIGLADTTFKERHSNYERFQTSEILQLQRISQICVGIKGEKHCPNNQMGNIK